MTAYLPRKETISLGLCRSFFCAPTSFSRDLKKFIGTEVIIFDIATDSGPTGLLPCFQAFIDAGIILYLRLSV
jgi:hypothetical protein